MNLKKREIAKYKLLHLLKFNSRTGNKEGYVKIYHNNTKGHELIKFKISYKLKKEGYSIYSEADFVSGGRADIIAISPEGEGYIIEVLGSETDKMFEEKLSKYPEEFQIVKVKVQDFDENTWEV